MNECLLSIREARQFLGISRATFYRLMESEQLPFIQVGGVRRIDPDALRSYLDSNTHGEVRQ